MSILWKELKMGKVFIVNPAKCNGCRNCQIACKDEHVDNDWSPYAKPQPDTGQFWLLIDETVRGSVPKVCVSYIAKLCMHCENAPCIDAAKNSALYRREDGLVIIDPEKAKGQKAIVEACPYDAIFWNEELEIPQKCTGCAHLLDDGWTVPRCVDVCPHEAIRFGDEEDFVEEIAQSELLIDSREEDRPRVHYINLPQRFVAGTIIDLEEDEVVIGAKISIENKENGKVLTTETDDFGDFWFKQIEAAWYTVYIEADGYLTREVEANALKADCNIGSIDIFAAQE